MRLVNNVLECFQGQKVATVLARQFFWSSGRSALNLFCACSWINNPLLVVILPEPFMTLSHFHLLLARERQFSIFLPKELCGKRWNRRTTSTMCTRPFQIGFNLWIWWLAKTRTGKHNRIRTWRLRTLSCRCLCEKRVNFFHAASRELMRLRGSFAFLVMNSEVCSVVWLLHLVFLTALEV